MFPASLSAKELKGYLKTFNLIKALSLVRVYGCCNSNDITIIPTVVTCFLSLQGVKSKLLTPSVSSRRNVRNTKPQFGGDGK
jgi:hypothetical protein